MAKYIGGVAITGFIAPTDTSDTFATHDSVLGRGGLREVDSLEARDAIPDDRRRIGMIVYVLAEQKYYALFGDTTNLSWKDCGSQLGGYDELLAEMEAITEELESFESEFIEIDNRLDKLEAAHPTYELSISLTGRFDLRELLFVNIMPYNVLTPEPGDCIATCLVPATATLVMYLDNVPVGTIAFDSTNIGIVTFDDTPINRNSILTIVAPEPASQLADVGVHLTFLIRENV